jgi:hypothetical protein
MPAASVASLVQLGGVDAVEPDSLPVNFQRVAATPATVATLATVRARTEFTR